MSQSTAARPARRTQWHHTDGSLHLVEAIVDVHLGEAVDVTTVIYRSTDGTLHGKPLATWHDDFKPAQPSNPDCQPQIEETRKAVDDLAKRLDIIGGMISFGERISWGSDTAIMTEAALRLKNLMASLEAASTGLTAIPEGHTIIRLAKVPPAQPDTASEWVCCGTYTPCRGECSTLQPKVD